MTTTARTDSHGALLRRVHGRLVQERLADPGPGDGPVALRERLGELLRSEAPLLERHEFGILLGELVAEVAGLGPLEPLLADPSVTEVMVNGPGVAYVERGGVVEPVALDLDADGLVRLVDRVVAPLGLRLDHASPLVEARLADGSRLHAVLPPLAVDGPCVTIRRFGSRRLPLEAFGATGPVAAMLRTLVASGANLLVSGGTGAGKTTLVGALAAAIDCRERVVTIEETAELRLAQPHVVRLEARPANAEGVGEVSVRTLVRAALRMRPDRIVVGEVRGPEAIDMLAALNTGHSGSMSTLHANGPADALVRLETLATLAGVGLPLHAIRAQVRSAIDAVVHVERGPAGMRRVTEVAEPAARGVRQLARTERGRLVVAAAPERAPRRSSPAVGEEGA